MLTLVTPTGDRPEAFALCQRWMQAQTYRGPVDWIVVNDGTIPLVRHIHKPWAIKWIDIYPTWKTGQNTQGRNLTRALESVHGDARVLVIEDDDYYHPTYLDTMAQLFDQAELIGERHARYYNVRDRWGKTLGNQHHSSLAATGVRGRALARFRQLCAPPAPKYIDMDLWKLDIPKVLTDNGLVIGIKGLPGRAGIGGGHVEQFLGAVQDPDGRWLRSWLGKDAEAYA